MVFVNKENYMPLINFNNEYNYKVSLFIYKLY